MKTVYVQPYVKEIAILQYEVICQSDGTDPYGSGGDFNWGN